MSESTDSRQPKDANKTSRERGELAPSIHQLFKKGIGEFKETQASKLQENGITVVEKTDPKSYTFWYRHIGYTQKSNALFYDFVGPNEHNPIQHLNVPREELLKDTGDTELMPPNLKGRIALREVVGDNSTTQPAQEIISVEFWGKLHEFDIKDAVKIFDDFIPEIGRNLPNSIKIQTYGKTQEEITSQLQKALEYMAPFLG